MGDGVIYTLSKTNFLVVGSVGGSVEDINTAQCSIDTGELFNIIRPSTLPPGWECLIYKKVYPRLNYSNVIPLELGESVFLTLLFSNALSRVKIIISSLLAVEVIIGTSFLNRQVLAIWCTQQLISFVMGNFPL